MPGSGENQNGKHLAMALADDRQKWNDRYREAAALGPPAPHPLALRWRGRMVGGTMLDAACGLGRGIAAVGHLFHTVYGVDLSEVAIARARRVWAGRSIEWIVGDVTVQPWEPDCFGLVCAFGFTDLPFFRRMRGSIRPGGMIVYEGFSRRQLEAKPDLDPGWTSSPADWDQLLAGWEFLERGESTEAPFRIRCSAIRPATG
jgi:SAM-dependent methyltransferase